jgi:glycosyltransferase involved in cell wall biosynthesis
VLVLLALPYCNRGGTERHALLLGRYLRRQGWTVQVAAPPGEFAREFAEAGCEVVPLPDIKVSTFPAAMRHCRAAAAKADLVHVHAAQEFCFGLHFAGYRGPIVFTAHGYSQALDYAKAGLFLNPFCRRVIAVSETEKAKLRIAGVRNLAVVPNGIDLQPFETCDRDRARAELEWHGSTPVAVTVGRLDRLKAAHDAILALAAGRTRFTLVLVGGGPEEPRLRRMAAALGVEAQVRFLGWRQDVPRLLAAADIYISPSRSEASPLALLEALAAGLPVVASDIPAHKEIVRNGQEGLIYRRGRARDLANAISLLCDVPGARNPLAEGARRRALAFSWEEMGARTVSVYERALTSGQGR